MFKNYLLIGFRFLRKHKMFALINVCGLAVGLTCALCIFLFVHDELSFDSWNPNSSRVYRVIQGGLDAEQSSSLPFPSGPTLQNDYPDLIETNVRLFNFQASSLPVVYEGDGNRKAFNETRFFFADSSFFRVFPHSFIAGEPEHALRGPNLLVITRSTALRYFGSTDAVGKVFRFEGKTDMTVTGVVEDVPDNTHFKFDFLASFSSLQWMFEKGIPESNWYWNPVWTYVLLRPGVVPGQLNSQMSFFVNKYYHPSLRENTNLVLQPLTDIYLKSKSEYEIAAMSDIRYVYIFSIISVAVLLIACINFINLTTAHSADRFKEIGMRKVMGAYRRNLVFQFISESLLVTILATFLALALTAALIPFLNNLTEKHLSIVSFFRWDYLLQLTAGIVAVGVIAGSYPAFVLSGHHAAHVLKSNTAGISGSAFLRKSLVVFQFAVSVIFVSGSILAYQQISYMRSAKLGFAGDQIIVLPVQRLSLVPKYESFKEVLLTNSGIRSISTSNTIVGRDYQASNYKKEGQDDMQLYPCLFVRNDFARTMGVDMLAGQDFSTEMTAPGYQAIVNKAFAETFGWTRPEDAIGQIIDGTLEGKIQITGVSDNFHFASLKQAVGPMIMMRCDMVPKHRDFFTRFVMIRVSSTEIQSTVAFIRKTWDSMVAESPFDYFFLDDNLDKLYKSEEKFNAVSTVFSVIAIAIGALGLFGLAAFSVQKRRKEISIRRVLGASANTILTLLSRDFVLLIVISALIGIPVTYYLMEEWLSGFAFRIQMGAGVFAVSVVLLLLITLLTISFTTVRASRANPVDSLRSE
jgi:putative ABC transport system permease protein